MRHRLKTWPDHFQAVWDGRKPFEVRRNDRDYHVGDVLELMEWNPDTELFSGRMVTAIVSYMVAGGKWGLPDDLCVLGFTDTLRTKEATGP